jgi:hypothetical protein
MGLFLQTALSFPTVVFSMLLAAAVAYWLLASLGLLEIDVLDGLFGGDADVDAETIAGPLMRYGLGGVPLTLVLTVLIFFSWLLCYFVELLLLRHLPVPMLHWMLGVAVAAGAVVVAAFITGIVLRPARRFFAQLRAAPQKSVLGQSGVVRSPEVTPSQGTATVEDGGAGLILQVRDTRSDRFKRGDRVVLIEYLAEQNAYRIVGEDEFQGL